MAITLIELKERLRYNPKTGHFTRLVNAAKAKKGMRAGYCTHARGYIQLTVKSKEYYAHRLAWFYMTGKWPVAIDHINGKTSDNRFANLRECSHDQNMQNMKVDGTTKNKSGHIGVTFLNGRWRSALRYTQDGKRHRLMSYHGTKGEAVAAYTAAKAMLHQFQPINRPR